MKNINSIFIAIVVASIMLLASACTERNSRDDIFGYSAPPQGCYFVYYSINYDEIGPYYSKLAYVLDDGSYIVFKAAGRKVIRMQGKLRVDTEASLMAWASDWKKRYPSKNPLVEMSDYGKELMVYPEPVEVFLLEVFPEYKAGSR